MSKSPANGRAGMGMARRSGRKRARHGEIQATMASEATHVLDQFERVLLRRGVGALEAHRACCTDCGRTPLTGEQVHLYDGRKQGIVCELCRQLRREPPVASELVRHCGHSHTVRITRPVA